MTNEPNDEVSDPSIPQGKLHKRCPCKGGAGHEKLKPAS
jgi:hypothetical protein